MAPPAVPTPTTDPTRDAPPSPAIVARQLGRAFGELWAVRDLTLTVGRAEVFGLLGHNGAGKTTLVRLLNGLLSPDGGAAEVLGLDPWREGPALRRRSGVLTETPALDERLTGRENLEAYAAIYGLERGRIPYRVDELLELFGLEERADERASDFSRGTKQRLALARTLLHDPEILFLDEPTSGLDPVAARQVDELIRELSAERERTVILCTHNLHEAQALCHRVAVLQRGRLVALGPPAELARRWGEHLTLRLEVAPGRRQAALNLLQERGYLASVEDGVIRLRGAGREATPDLVRLLVHAGVPLYAVTPEEPSLEDVYLALHSTSGAGRASAVPEGER